MSKAELETLRARLKAEGAKEQGGLAERRAGLDTFGVFPLPTGIVARVSQLGGVASEIVAAPDAVGPVILMFHGGGYVTGSPRSHRHVAGLIAAQTGGTVHLVDYRLAPEAPFPAAIMDGMTAYRALLDRHAPADIALIGDSAGGGLSFGVALSARAAKLPMPAAIVGLSPWVNLGTDNESHIKLASVDPILANATNWYADHYLGNTPSNDPLASPLYADLTGLPPVLIQVGDHEVFFGDATLMHQNLIAAGVDAELSVWKGMFHVWHLFWPMLGEGSDALRAASDFILAHCTIATKGGVGL